MLSLGDLLGSPTPSRPTGARTTVGLTATAFAGAVVLAAALALSGTDRIQADLLGDSAWRLAVGVDRLAAVLLVLMTGIGLVVQAYAARALRHDPIRPRFLAWSGLLLAASLLVAAAASPIALALAWAVGGLALVRLVGTAGPGGRELRRSILLGDAALIAAMVALTAAAPGLDLQAPGAVAAAAGTSLAWAVVALGLVVAVAARSAQSPFRNWLPASVAAPTAVSALLHAGVVNGGAVLLLRAGGVLDAFPATWFVIAAIAAWTMVTSVSAVGVTPDSKGVLVRSTQAQTGFLLLTVAAAAPIAAVAHLVGHAAYKAGAFLGVGGVVGARRRAHALDTPAVGQTHRLALGGLAVVASGALLLAAVALMPGYDPSPVLAGFAVATAAAALVGWFAHRPDARGVALGLVAATVLVPVYVAGLAALEAYLEPALGGAAALDGVGWPALLIAAVAAAVPAAARALARLSPTPTLEDAVFRFALATAAPPRPALVPVTSRRGQRGAR
jgi:NADH:ubiquinone oxidoreductase subunit 5 (subunit L)/multisubunit Na+/H+ antiporter MnhA subunit